MTDFSDNLRRSDNSTVIAETTSHPDIKFLDRSNPRIPMEIIVIYQIHYEARNNYDDDGRSVLKSYRWYPDMQFKSRSIVQSINRHVTGKTTYRTYRYFVSNLRSGVHPLFAGEKFYQ